MERTHWIGVPVSLLCAAAVGCGESEPAERPVAQTQTVVVRTVVQTVAEPAKREAPADAQESVGDDSSVESADAGSDDSGAIRVPDVVGEDHQLAQDTMQAAGLYSLREQDASGQGRMLIVDRNWTVVRQKPAAGTRVSEDTTITLYSVKDTEL